MFLIAECWAALLDGICPTDDEVLHQLFVILKISLQVDMPDEEEQSLPPTTNHAPSYKHDSSLATLCKYQEHYLIPILQLHDYIC